MGFQFLSFWISSGRCKLRVSPLLVFGFGSDFQARDSGTENEPLSVPFLFQVKRLKASQEICDPFPEHTGVVFKRHTKMDLHPIIDEIRFELGTDSELEPDLRTTAMGIATAQERARKIWSPPASFRIMKHSERLTLRTTPIRSFR